MALKMSSGLCSKLHDTNPTKTLFNLSFLKIYAGTPPATADAAALTGSNVLCTVSNNDSGTGLTFAASATLGVLPKATAETWSGTNGNTGTATHFRLVAAGDDGLSSTTQARLQGTIGTGGTDMVVGNTSLTSGALFTINYATLSFVPS